MASTQQVLAKTLQPATMCYSSEVGEVPTQFLTTIILPLVGLTDVSHPVNRIFGAHILLPSTEAEHQTAQRGWR